MASYDDTATVSGSIVRVNDGADSVGLKNWLVTLPASLSGYSEVNGVRSGANLFNEDWEVGGINDTTGLPNSDTNKIRSKSFSIIKGGTTCYVSVPQPIRVLFYASDESFISETANIRNNSFSVPSNCSLFKIRGTVDYGTTYNNDIMISYGSTATSYEAYEAPTQYTASLGRTIYGGQADIVTGEGEDKGVIEVFDTVEGNVIKSQFNSFNKVNGNISVLGTNVRITFAVESGDQSAYNRISNTYTADEQLCNLASHSFSYASDTTHWYRNTVLYLFLPVADVGTTAESVYNYLTGLITNGTPLKFYLPYNIPTDFTFTPIQAETELGTNNFWSDQGNTELTYYKDGYGFTSVTIHKETPDGEPVEQTAKLHRIIYEGQVDVISGTGLIYRGESGTQYDPPEQISFTPIDVSTDEGENTLYADQGDSAITYRKEI